MSESGRAGRVEKFLVFGILVVIGLILVVAINGAQSIEDEDAANVASAQERDEGAAAESAAEASRGGPGQPGRVRTPGPGAGKPPRPGRDPSDRENPSLRVDAGEAAREAGSSTPGERPVVATTDDGSLMGLLGSLGESPTTRTQAPPATRSGGEVAGLGSVKLQPGDVPIGSAVGEKAPGEGRVSRREGAPGDAGGEDPGAVVRSPPPNSRESAGPSSEGGDWVYVVKEGESLSQISRRYFGRDGYWPEIMAENPFLTAPEHLRAGQRLSLPSSLELVTRTGLVAASSDGVSRAAVPAVAVAPPSATESPRFKRIVSRSEHKVAKGESLMMIARQTYGTETAWRFLYEANRDRLRSADHVVEGQVLTLPREG